MATCLQIVLRCPWQDASGVVSWMKTKAHRLLTAEHEADDDVKHTHLHIAIEPTVSTEAIRKQLIKNSLGGEKHQILTTCMKKMDGLEKAKYEFMALAKYCIKGDKTQIRESTLSHEEHTTLEKEWINRVKKYDFGTPDTSLPTAEWVEPARSAGEWDKLLYAFKQKPDRIAYSMSRVRKFIISFYLTQEKPPPRAGDLSRYAYGLYAIIHKHQAEKDISFNDIEFSVAFGHSFH